MNIAMSLEIEDGKTAHISQAINMNGELPEEVNDRWCTIR